MNCYIINKQNVKEFVKFEFNGYFIDDLVNILSSLENIEDFYITFEKNGK